MAEIQAFQGVLYDPQRVRPVDVLTQPYDKVTPEMREKYLQRSPYNLIGIELGKEAPGDTATNNKYTRAAELYRKWLQAGVLRRSARPALYYLEQTFQLAAGMAPPTARTTDGMFRRRGLIARVRLSRWDEGQILPHERTLSKPKVDRLALLRACGAQQGQIFMMYPSPREGFSDALTAAVQSSAPAIECLDDYQVTNRLWEISDPALIRAAQEAVRDSTFYIADGHHRYETALAFRDDCRATGNGRNPDAPSEFVMATLVEMSDPGLVVLPTHRTVANLAGYDRSQFRRQLAESFTAERQPSVESLLAAMHQPNARSCGSGQTTPHPLGMFDGEAFIQLQPKDPRRLQPLFAQRPPLWHTLDVAILHVAILEALLGVDDARLREEANVSYWREPEQAVDQVRRGLAQLAFFLNPTPVSAVRAIADAGSRMPQKSTDFYPKLLSGLVMYEVCPGGSAAR